VHTRPRRVHLIRRAQQPTRRPITRRPITRRLVDDTTSAAALLLVDCGITQPVRHVKRSKTASAEQCSTR
jgi:hypothetical protein